MSVYEGFLTGTQIESIILYQELVIMNRRDFLSKNSLLGAGLLVSSAARALGEKPDAPLRIGQIGVTHEHAGARMKSLRSLSGLFEVVGVVDDRESKAARLAGQDMKPFDGLRWMKEEELFQVPGLRAVTVETANGDLVPTAIRCMERGLAIGMDKPGGADFSLFKKLIEGCRQKKLPFQMGYMFRKNPAIELIQKAVREGWLGDVFEIQASMSHDYGSDEAYQKYLAHYQGGIVYNLSCHHIDWVVSLLGRPERVIPVLGSTKSAKHGVTNLGLTVLQYPHAVVALHVCDAEVRGLPNRYVKVCGTKGTMEIRPLERFDGKPLLLDLRLKAEAGGYPAGDHVIDLGPQKDRYDLQLREFAAMIRGEAESPYSYDHDLLAQEVHLAASGF